MERRADRADPRELLWIAFLPRDHWAGLPTPQTPSQAQNPNDFWERAHFPWHFVGVQPKSVVEHFHPDLATYIGQYELLWSAAPMASYPELFRGRKVIHFIDNSGACAALIKGYASAIDCGLPCHGHLSGLQRAHCTRAL